MNMIDVGGDIRVTRGLSKNLWCRLLLLCAVMAIAQPGVQSQAAALTNSSEPFIASTQQGKVRGQAASDGSITFQSIPYARPPVGNLRWREPQAPEPWSGIRDATMPPHACMQIDWKWNSEDAKNDSEDCLYLNIATPVWPMTEKLPVLFWIHGGANYSGSGRMRAQTLTRHGIILVRLITASVHSVF
jgi:Carboxylesterase family